jgi:hypothetical protein
VYEELSTHCHTPVSLPAEERVQKHRNIRIQRQVEYVEGWVNLRSHFISQATMSLCLCEKGKDDELFRSSDYELNHIVERLFVFSRNTSDAWRAFMGAISLIKKLRECGLEISATNCPFVLVACTMLAYKVIEDEPPKTDMFALASGLNLQSLAFNEFAVLERIGYACMITNEDIQSTETWVRLFLGNAWPMEG